jgi:hypothetical protein
MSLGVFESVCPTRCLHSNKSIVIYGGLPRASQQGNVISRASRCNPWRKHRTDLATSRSFGEDTVVGVKLAIVAQTELEIYQIKALTISRKIALIASIYFLY